MNRQKHQAHTDSRDVFESPFLSDADLLGHRRPFSSEDADSGLRRYESDDPSDAFAVSEQRLAELATALEGAAFRTKMLSALRMTVGGSPEGLVEGERRSYPPRLLVWNQDGHELATVTLGGRSGCFLIARPDGGSEMASDAAMAAALVAGHRADGLPITGVRDE